MAKDLAVVEGAAVEALGDLAATANREHAACETAYGTALDHAYRAGQALTRAKGQLEHGEWLPWLEGNFKAERSTAERYIRLAKANASRMTHLIEAGASITEALKELQPPKQAEDNHKPEPQCCPTCGRRLPANMQLPPVPKRRKR